MRLSAKGRYAVTCLIDLAVHASSGPVTLADIAQRQSISLSYVEQLFARLRQADLVQGMRGPGGGYRLTRATDAITVAQILVAVEESAEVGTGYSLSDCHRGEQCLTHELWSELSEQIQGFLGGITLQMVIDSSDVTHPGLQPDLA